jgi:hypothetical protein
MPELDAILDIHPRFDASCVGKLTMPNLQAALKGET